MNELQEMIYEQGSRAALCSILSQCLNQLGYQSGESTKAGWILEREATVAALREVCGGYGDNNWANELHLADVVNKHLLPHLREGRLP